MPKYEVVGVQKIGTRTITERMGFIEDSIGEYKDPITGNILEVVGVRTKRKRGRDVPCELELRAERITKFIKEANSRKPEPSRRNLTDELTRWVGISNDGSERRIPVLDAEATPATLNTVETPCEVRYISVTPVPENS